jgi:hypothetical protein
MSYNNNNNNNNTNNNFNHTNLKSPSVRLNYNNETENQTTQHTHVTNLPNLGRNSIVPSAPQTIKQINPKLQRYDQQQSNPNPMSLLHQKLSTEYDLKHQLLNLEARYAHLKQDLEDRKNELKSIEAENSEYEKKIEVMEENFEEYAELEEAWKTSGEAVLKKRLDGLKRDSSTAKDRKQTELDGCAAKLSAERNKNDIYSTWLTSHLQQRVQFASKQLLDHISSLEKELADYKNRNGPSNSDYEALICEHPSLQGDTSIVGQKKNLAKLKKQVDDLKHELQPWTEALQHIQKSIEPLKAYPLTLANALLESKLTPQQRTEYLIKKKQYLQQQHQQFQQQQQQQQQQQPNQSQSYIQASQPLNALDLTTHLERFPFNSDMQFIDIFPAMQSPIGQIYLPTDQDVNVSLQLFDFQRLIDAWLIPSLRIDITQANEKLDIHGDNDNQLIETVVEFDTKTSTSTTTTTTTTTTSQSQQKKGDFNNPIGPYQAINNPFPNLNHQTTIELPPIPAFYHDHTSEIPSQHSIAAENAGLSPDIWDDPLLLWKYDLTAYLVPTYSNALRLLQSIELSDKFHDDININGEHHGDDDDDDDDAMINPHDNNCDNVDNLDNIGTDLDQNLLPNHDQDEEFNSDLNGRFSEHAINSPNNGWGGVGQPLDGFHFASNLYNNHNNHNNNNNNNNAFSWDKF